MEANNDISWTDLVAMTNPLIQGLIPVVAGLVIGLIVMWWKKGNDI